VAEPVAILVDSNVILDVVTEDPRWGRWSGDRLAECADRSVLAINPIVYAEVSTGFARIEDLDDALPAEILERRPCHGKRPSPPGSVSSITDGVVESGRLPCRISISAPMRPLPEWTC
jgi:hypothetical protein